jgi:hypothetical protein
LVGFVLSKIPLPPLRDKLKSKKPGPFFASCREFLTICREAHDRIGMKIPSAIIALYDVLPEPALQGEEVICRDHKPKLGFRGLEIDASSFVTFPPLSSHCVPAGAVILIVAGQHQSAVNGAMPMPI